MTFFSIVAAMLLLSAGAVHANDQVKWDTVSQVAPWYFNHELTSELHKSVKDFFGNAVAAYFTEPTGTITGQAKKFATDTKWHLISSQFYGSPGTHIDPVKGTILNGQWNIYAYEENGAPLSAFVTPINSTQIVAAMIVHEDCSPISRHGIANHVSVKSHFHQCELASIDHPAGMVTVFFKNRFSVNRQIRDVLLAFATKPSIMQCKSNITTMSAPESVSAAALAKQCRMRWKVVLLDRRQQ